MPTDQGREEPTISDGLERARADIDAGRLWKARDRLRGVVGARPADQDALGLLGEVHLRMGDDPEAGRWLFVTELDDDAARARLPHELQAKARTQGLDWGLSRAPARRPRRPGSTR